ncbi:hypothetical protein ONZ45_g7314 [Pleurotus djamor]|nr:hypothetical protein ONZ45_g7314 [Pleurotus djamor]
MQQVNITPGMNLTTAQTASEPQFFLDIANATLANSTFVIAMVDPDAPTPQNTSISQVRHMLGGGFQRDPTTGMLSNTTAALSDYIPPAPPAGSDAHRYVILVFNQSSAFMENAPPFVAATPDRLNFNLTQFVESVQLGTPIAGNFFFTAPDNSTSTSTSTAASTPLSTAVTNGVTSYPAAATTAPGSDTSGALKMDQGFRAFLSKLPPGANRILFVKNLNYQITGEDLYDLFGRYGSIRQIRIGNEQKTKGTAFVVFDDVMDAKNALDHLNGFHLQERYIVVLYHMPAKQDAAAAKADLARREEELAQLKQKHNIGDD